MYLFPAVCCTFLAYLLVLTVCLIPCKATGNESFSSHESSCWRYSLPSPFQFLQNPTWRPQGHWCYLIVSHVREEVASFLGFLLGISVMQEFYLVANPQGKTFVFQKCYSFVERFVQVLQMYIACNMQSSIQRK